MATTDYTYNNPAGISLVTVECWGAGGGGSTSGSPSFIGGGGGGAYSRKNVAVTPGNSYLARLGNGGSSSAPLSNGGDSTFFGDAGDQCLAVGGGIPSGHTGGLGGQAAAGNGTVKFSGGNGGLGDDTSDHGAGGGSSAGRSADGNTGASSASGGGVTPGPDAAGPGGAGGPSGGPAPAVPSGYGGGGGTGGSSFQAGATGFDGLIVIWRPGDYGNPSAVPLGVFAPGSIVPPFPAVSGRRGYSFVM